MIYFGVLDNGNKIIIYTIILNFVTGIIEGLHLSSHQMSRISKQIEDTFLQFDPCVGREFYE